MLHEYPNVWRARMSNFEVSSPQSVVNKGHSALLKVNALWRDFRTDNVLWLNFCRMSFSAYFLK